EAHRRDLGGNARADAPEHAVGAARRPGECGRGSTLPLLRRGRFHHRGGAARRRRARNVSTDFSLNGRRRVVITGLGLVSPLGNDVESSWQSLVDGEAGAAEITAFHHADYGVYLPCERQACDPTDATDRTPARRPARSAHTR